MSTKTILVSAFFNIGRENFSVNPRKIEKYFNDFKFWAGIKNFLVIYTTKEFFQEIINIREKLGLSELTKVIIIKDIFEIRNDLFLKAKKVEESEHFKNFRYRSDALSSKAKYDHLMFLKAYFLKCTKDLFTKNDEYIWIDFGFNHGGDYFLDSSEFNFEIKPIMIDKIWIFSLYNQEILNKLSTFRVIQTLKDFILGSIFFVPGALIDFYWEQIQTSYANIIDLGFIDDDQLLTLNSYLRNPDFFLVTKSNWFKPMELLSKKKFNHNTNYDNRNLNFLSKFKLKYRIILKKILYLIKIWKNYES